MIHLTKQAVIDPNGVEQVIIMTVDGQSFALTAAAAFQIAGQLMFLAAELDPVTTDETLR